MNLLAIIVVILAIAAAVAIAYIAWELTSERQGQREETPDRDRRPDDSKDRR